MKILAIRGKNLASLAQEFDLDLETGPLGEAGIFSITGPTGSGKTTLLDAMCLALFDKLPRLEGVNNYTVGNGADPTALLSQDVRNILRRGAASCHAQVDFLGGDGRRYRSTWSVRRARNRIDGKFQKQELRLEDLSGEGDIGDHRKQETLKLIVEKLGLNFEQFCRSVLLAQGRFAAFLQAKPAERSQLLERMTGTEIYSRLSMAAFETAKAEQEALKDLNRRGTDYPVRNQQEREELEQACEAAGQARAEAEREVNGLKAAGEWYDRLAQMKRGEQEAEAALQAAETRLAGLVEAAAFLAEVEAAQPLRHPLKTFDQAEKDRAETEKALARDEAALVKAEARLTATATDLKTRGEVHAKALAALDKARPDLIKARELDTRLTAHGERVTAAETALRDARTGLEAVNQELKDETKKQAALKTELAEAKAWLDQRAGDAPAVAAWGSLSRDLKAAIENGKRLTKADAVMPAEEAKRRAQAKLVEAAEKAVATADTARQAADQEAVRLESAATEAAAKFEPDRATALERERTDWQRVLNLVEAHGLLLAQREKLEEDRQRFSVTADEARVAVLDEELSHDRVALREAEGGLKLAESTSDLSTKRDLLREGEPCPLCGGHDHPYRHETPVLSQLLKAQRERVAELQMQVTQKDGERTGLLARIETHRKQLAHLDAEAARLNAQLESRAAERDQAAEALKSDASEGLFLETGALTQTLARLEEEEATLKRVKAAADAARSAAIKARETAAKARDAWMTAKEAAGDQVQALTKMDHDLNRYREVLQRLRQERETLHQALAPVFAMGMDPKALDTDPVGFEKTVTAQIEAWRTMETKASDVKDRLNVQEREIALLNQQHKTCTDQLPQREQDHRELLKTSGALSQERAALLDGRPADQVERALEAARSEGEEQRKAAETAHQTASSDRRALVDRIADRKVHLERCQTRCAEALTELEQRTAAAGLSIKRVRELSVHDQAWITRERHTHQTAKTDRDKAVTVRDERRARREEHERTQPPEIPAELVAERRREAEAAFKAVDDKRGDLTMQLKLDDQNRERLAELLPQIEAQQAKVTQWEIMRGLIGSADGKKFRTFAQSLTLEALVGCADVHLRQLAPRYRLQRVPGEDLELQVVDGIMADEVRSLSSLSGGEGFLVSLALALGLSTLSSNRAHIGSLFIDEGFSTLDAHTLDTALAALESLQAGGLQIGVISHLPAIAERVAAHVTLTRSSGGSSLVKVKANL